jgi:hypothetical protein
MKVRNIAVEMGKNKWERHLFLVKNKNRTTRDIDKLAYFFFSFFFFFFL